MTDNHLLNTAIIKDIADQVPRIDIGTITISIFKSRIVQVDVTKTETRRFEQVWLENGEGI